MSERLLPTYLAKEPQVFPQPNSEEYEFFKANYQNLQQDYQRKWVVVSGSSVIGSEDAPYRAAEIAVGAGENAIVNYVRPVDSKITPITIFPK